MKFTKNTGAAVSISIISLIIFNAVAFLTPFLHTVTFWLGYCFATMSIVVLLISSLVLFGKNDSNTKFLSVPQFNVALIYFILQIALSFAEMTNSFLTYKIAVIINCVLIAVFLIAFLLVGIGKSAVESRDSYTNNKRFYIKNIQTELELIESTDSEVTKALNDLKESVRFSDPMSHSQLAAIENKIENKVCQLKEQINIKSEALCLCSEIQLLLKERNQKTKLLKNIPDKYAEKDNTSGAKVVGGSLALCVLVLGIILTVIFIIVPTQIYNGAVDDLNAEKYEIAIAEFESIKGFKDSEQQIESAKTEINTNLYSNAETEYKNGNYVVALDIYKKLGDFENSKERIEQINNMLATGKEIYFGSYNGNSVAWIILEQKDDKMFLLAKELVIQMPISNQIEKVDWKDSTLNEWLNHDFLAEFTDEQMNKIDKKNGVFLLSQKDFEEYKKDTDFSATSDWWLSTKSDDGFMYAEKNGSINENGDMAIRAKGIRPAMWISID